MTLEFNLGFVKDHQQMACYTEATGVNRCSPVIRNRDKKILKENERKNNKGRNIKKRMI